MFFSRAMMALLFVCLGLFAQVPVNQDRVYKGLQDYSTATVKPPQGSAAPTGSCPDGTTYKRTGVSPAVNYTCLSGAWVQDAGGSGGFVAPVFDVFGSRFTCNSGNTGKWFYPTDGFYNQFCDGTSFAASLFEGRYVVPPPAASGWTALNSAAFSDDAGAVRLDVPGASGDNLRMMYKSYPGTTPQTLTALLRCNDAGAQSSNGLCGIGITDGTKAQILAVRPSSYSAQSGTAETLQYAVINYTNSTTVAATPFTSHVSLGFAAGGTLWLRYVDTGTNLIYQVSRDGRNFTQLYTIAKSSNFITTPTGWGVAGNAGQTTSTLTATLLHWQSQNVGSGGGGGGPDTNTELIPSSPLAFSTSTPVNSYAGFVGMKFHVDEDHVATSLGRICIHGQSGISDNALTHNVRIVRSSDNHLMASVTVDMASCLNDTFVYAAITGPTVTLATGVDYYLVTQESNGGDYYYPVGAISQFGAGINGGITGWVNSTNGNSGNWNEDYTNNRSAGIPNVRLQ